MPEKENAPHDLSQAWLPSEEIIRRANVTRLIRETGCADYPALHRWSVENREAFWEQMARTLNIRFRQPPSRTLGLKEGVRHPSWFPGARMNIAESCFHADADAPAIVYGNADGLSRVSQGDLRALCNRVSNGLLRMGFRQGDALAIAMPMIPESVAIYLGIIQAGCVVVAIADSLAAGEISARLQIADTRGIFTLDHWVRAGKPLGLYEKIAAANAPAAIVLSTSAATPLRKGDVRWEDFLDENAGFDPVAASPDSPITILFSSGTTAAPKAIPWDHVTPVKCASDGYCHHDIHPGDVVCWPTNLGWMMGPWLIFATLINRGTIALFGDSPTERPFGQFVQDARVTLLGVVPSLVRRWRETECMEGLDWSRIHAFSSTGECSNPEDMAYLMRLAGHRPVIEYCGGTEIGGGYVTGTVVQPGIPGTFSTPALGSDFVILDEDGRPAEKGEVFLVPPSIGLSRRLLNHDHDKVYHAETPQGPHGEILRRHGDEMHRLPNGHYRALGRSDNTMNLGGIKVGSAEIESALLEKISGLKEIAAIAVPPAGGGPEKLVLFAVARENHVFSPAQLHKEAQKVIRENLGPLFKVHDVVLLDALPRTASQKVMHRELRANYRACPASTP